MTAIKVLISFSDPGKHEVALDDKWIILSGSTQRVFAEKYAHPATIKTRYRDAKICPFRPESK